MRQLILFFQKNYSIFLFFLLEIVALFFLFSRNSYHKAKFLNGTSIVQTTVNAQQQKYTSYLNLDKTNELLAEENKNLYKELEQLKNKLPVQKDSLQIDSITNANFTFQSAKVITSFKNLSNTYLTLDKGKKDSVQVESGVLFNNEVIGKVVYVEDNYSLVMPIFHLNSKVNSKHLPSDYSGNLEWNGKNFNSVQLNKIPRNANVEIGDTIVTNQYSKAFPEGTKIGFIDKVDLDYSKNFYLLEVNPFIEFSKLNYVYIAKRRNLEEIQQIESQL